MGMATVIKANDYVDDGLGGAWAPRHRHVRENGEDSARPEGGVRRDDGQRIVWRGNVPRDGHVVIRGTHVDHGPNETRILPDVNALRVLVVGHNPQVRRESIIRQYPWGPHEDGDPEQEDRDSNWAHPSGIPARV